MEAYRSDLHVHTVLSPCAEIEMLPPLIIQEALECGIRLIAITDHNASGNIAVVQQAAQGLDLTVLPGMELQTREEVHVLCLFDTLEQVQALQKQVDAALPDLENDAEHFGMQILVDAQGDPLGEEMRLLLTSTGLTIEEAQAIVQELDGLFIPAHVDRQGFSLLTNLGFVPTELHPDALEITRHLTPTAALQRFPQLRGFSLVQNGDAHTLDDILGSTIYYLRHPTIAEIKLALAGQENRSYQVIC